METLQDIWNEVLSVLQQKVNETAFNLWLKPITIHNFENNVVELMFSSKFKKDTVVNQYGVLLQKTFSEVIGFEIKIEFLAPEDFLSNEEKNAKDLDEYKNNQYTFDNFIVGPSNKFAYAAAKAVAGDPGGIINKVKNLSNYNPLFIYGNSGLGKTHLLNAICYEVERNYPNMKVCYVKSETFANEFISCLQKKTTDEFHQKYRENIDVLLVDDIQFIAGKISTEEEFFHTFNALVDSGKQVVLTSDRPPKEIQSLEDRLRTRFEWGLLADIQSPEYETRCAIIKRKAEMLDFQIPDDVVNFIAEKIKVNIRQLEGTTKKLHAMSQLDGKVPSIALAQTIIKDVVTSSQPLPVTIKKIVEEVSRTTGISVEDIYSKKQKATISKARKITFYIVREVTGMSYESIGEEFDKHHSTVMYNVEQIEKELKIDSKLARSVNDIITNIKEMNA